MDRPGCSGVWSYTSDLVVCDSCAARDLKVGASIMVAELHRGFHEPAF
jgi:hypothetical protein